MALDPMQVNEDELDALVDTAVSIASPLFDAYEWVYWGGPPSPDTLRSTIRSLVNYFREGEPSVEAPGWLERSARCGRFRVTAGYQDGQFVELGVSLDFGVVHSPHSI